MLSTEKRKMSGCSPLTVVLYWLVAVSVAQAGQIIDQQYTPDPVPNHVNIDTVRGFLSGQSFMPSLSGVDFVVLNIEAAGGHASTPPGNYLLEIRQGQGDSGPLLGTSNPVLLPTGLPPTNIEFDFSSVVPLMPGDLYSLVVNNADPGSGSNFLVGYSTAAGYSAGSGFGSATGDYDLYFQEGLIVPEPATLGMLAAGFVGAGLMRCRRKRPQQRVRAVPVANSTRCC